ncbi:MAG: IS21 family transposase [Nitrospinae bacterium]|nr:IS21 family transposase [Nitrospinota bacterium]
MPNILKMAKVNAIIGLLELGWSRRRIGRELGIHRETVSRYAKSISEAPKPAKVTAGSSGDTESKPAIPPPGSCEVAAGSNPKPAKVTAGSGASRSMAGPFLEVVSGKLDMGLSAQRIFQDIVADHGFTGSYSSVKRLVRRLGAQTPLPFRRMECAPGQEAQIDFGSGAKVWDNGKLRQSHVLRVVLSHSRKSYSQTVFRQDTESFIRCVENAVRHFGGVPRTLVIDNLKAAVKNADWFDPELNPKVMEFARHYGTVILPTKPYTPRHKGKIESGIKYVKNNALKGRVFNSLGEQNEHLRQWEKTIADTRIHGTTRKQVKTLFEDVELKTLLPLPEQPFPFYHEGRRRVHRDGHVEVSKSYYSVPPEYLGRDVWVRWDGRILRVFNDRFEQIAIHTIATPGRFSTAREHIASGKISGVERGAGYLLSKASRIGGDAAMWARAMLDSRGIEGVRVLQGFVGLAGKYPANAINSASRTALKSRCFYLKPVRKLCAAQPEQGQMEFAEEHPVIRPLSEYQELLFNKQDKPMEEKYEQCAIEPVA